MVASLTERAGEYVSNILQYKDELDDLEVERESRETLTEVIDRTPMMLVAYANGVDVDITGGPWRFDEGREYDHHCTFTVICLATTWELVERMLNDARQAIAGRRYFTTLEGERVFFNPTPLRTDPDPELRRSLTIAYLLRTTGLVSFALYLDTSFPHRVPARSEDVEVEINEININLGLANPGIQGQGETPGVHIEE